MYVIKDQNGKVTGLSLTNTIGAEPADPQDPSLREFLERADPSLSASNQLQALDGASIRILEDLIDVLVDRGTLIFTDLPEAAQQRLLERKLLRKMVRREKGLPEPDDEFLLSDDKIF
ncbi:MAG TPA: hypothetical protein VLA39_00225 [Marinobacterium sp.]|nr:hypothetical protein [Marinobacterium sp.]